jgi:hypothetical protein
MPAWRDRARQRLDRRDPGVRVNTFALVVA